MGIQKTRRGAYHGRADRKKSYKVCDLGMLVQESHLSSEGNGMDSDSQDDESVRGQMFGFTRNGHYRLILDRKKNKSLVVMPISFGHPAATDKELSFVLRFVSDAPILIQELEDVPRMDLAIQKFCLQSTWSPQTKQGQKKILLEVDSLYRVIQMDCLGSGGGTVFLYLYVNDQELQKRKSQSGGFSFSVKANCRGMACRTENGLLVHETISKGKKFEAAWRRYSCDFTEQKSRLLMVLVQSGQNTELGSIECKPLGLDTGKKSVPARSNTLDDFLGVDIQFLRKSKDDDYETRGIFNGTDCSIDLALSGNMGGEVENGSGNRHDEFDLELERALALSRGDMELQRAIELSRTEQTPLNQTMTRMDTDLQLAAPQEASFAAIAAAPSNNFVDRDLELALEESKRLTFTAPTMSFSQEIEKAIQLSLNESKQLSRPTGTSSSQDRKIVIDLTSSEAVTRGNDPLAPVAKKRKADEAVIVGVQDEDTVNKEDHAVNQVEKRRLAAEAAIKRFQTGK
jgi:hypothetical protein